MGFFQAHQETGILSRPPVLVPIMIACNTVIRMPAAHVQSKNTTPLQAGCRGVDTQTDEPEIVVLRNEF